MPIGELSRRVGVSTDLLRKWERRYGVLSPGRTRGNRRLYSQVDEARVRVMLGHVRGGIPPAQAAQLAIAARFRLSSRTSSDSSLDDVAHIRRELLAALRRYDETEAERILERIESRAGPSALIRNVFLPLLREVGDQWADDRLSVGQEHFVSEFVHGRMLALARGWATGLGPAALLACAPGEQHVFGLVAFGIILHQVGWRITYLGADTPLPGLAHAAAAMRPRQIVIASTLPGGLSPGSDVLRELVRRGPLALAGAGVTPELAASVGAQHLDGDPVSAAGRMLV